MSVWLPLNGRQISLTAETIRELRTIFIVRNAAGMLACGGPSVSRRPGAQPGSPLHQVQVLVNGVRISASELERIFVCHLVPIPSTCTAVSFIIPVLGTNGSFSQIFSLGPEMASEAFLTLPFTGMISLLDVMPELRVHLLILSS